MKKIVSWINLFIYLFLIFIFLVFLFLNRNETVSLDYILGKNDVLLSSLMFIVFLAGSGFGLIVSWFIGLRSYWKNSRRNKELKTIKKDLETLKENTKI